ncbi:MAG: YdeI/OmpD-associated family protein [Firmicutes bacterium]|nr:YdeI/OmpD-associated family protein [Bacillota bacterium]
MARKKNNHLKVTVLSNIIKAKRPETKEKRIAQMIEELCSGNKYMGMNYNAK